MTVFSDDNKRIVDIGSESTLFSVYSTVIVLLKRNRLIGDAVEFLKTGRCGSDNALNVARQVNLIRDNLAKFSPDRAVWDCRDRTKIPPWNGNLSPVVTSCANLYTTADGKDLLFELVSILTYAGVTRQSVYAL